METLDARGLACPGPVLLAKKTLDDQRPERLAMLVDNDAARENVGRFLASRGFAVSVERQGDDYLLSGVLQGGGGGDVAAAPTATATVAQVQPGADPPRVVVLVGSEQLGRGDEQLGGKLMVNYLKTLKEMGPELWQLIFVNGGVRLTLDDSPVLAELQEYERDGVIVLACGTCLAHFAVSERQRVGQSTNMLDIVTATQLADKVIALS